jgi:hypothetical protein
MSSRNTSGSLRSSQNILLIADGPIVELPEITDTYTDTWGKMVRYLEVRKYQSGADTIYTITPDFETLQYEGDVEEIVVEIEDERPKYPESYHLEDVSQTSVEIYNQVKAIAMRVDSSIKAGRNIAFIKVRNKKIRLIVMMPEDDIRKYAKNHSVAMLSPPVQKFYNGPCAAVDIQNLEHMDEIETLVLKMIEYNKGSG